MKRILAVTFAAALVLAACGSDDDPTESAMSGVCDAQEQVLADLDAIATADPAETTTEDLNSMLDSLESSVDELKEARGDLVEQDVDNVTSAFDSLKASLQDLGDVPLAELEDAAAAVIAEEAESLQAAYTEAYENSSCTLDGGE